MPRPRPTTPSGLEPSAKEGKDKWWNLTCGRKDTAPGAAKENTGVLGFKRWTKYLPQSQPFPTQKRFNSLGASSALATTSAVGSQRQRTHYAHILGAAAPYATLTRAKYTPPPAAGPSVPPSSPLHAFQVPAHAQQQQQRPMQLKRSEHPVRRTLSTTTLLLPPPASVPAARCSAAVLLLRAPSTPLPHRSPPNNCVRIARLCASPRVRATTAAASTRRARPVLSPRRCCAFSPCAARPIPSHPRRPPPMPVLCTGVPSPAPSICVPRFNANVLPSCPPFLAPRHACHTRTHLATAPVPHACPVAPWRRALSACPFSPPRRCRTSRLHLYPAFGASTVATLSNRLRTPTAVSTPTTPYPLPSPAALLAPAATRTTSPPSSLAAVLPAHLMNIYANPVPHATSPRRRLPAGTLPDCIQHRSIRSPSSPQGLHHTTHCTHCVPYMRTHLPLICCPCMPFRVLYIGPACTLSITYLGIV
ncbi:hypothetical protein B0H14DRAFT_3454149 [Mycena olivaceomarginata]|nr:hypothetical protein B0H14DRAFT_3454149 [Mycena olivaceomarginata]